MSSTLSRRMVLWRRSFLRDRIIRRPSRTGSSNTEGSPALYLATASRANIFIRLRRLAKSNTFSASGPAMVWSLMKVVSSPSKMWLSSPKTFISACATNLIFVVAGPLSWRVPMSWERCMLRPASPSSRKDRSRRGL